MSTNDWIINLAVFAVLMEADLGHRKIGWFRVVRPLFSAGAVVALYLTSVPTDGHNLALQAVGIGAGVLVGLASHLFMSVHFDRERGRQTSRAGVGYAAFWAVVFGARLLFIYGSEHWFSGSLGRFLVTRQLSVAGLTDALIFMALAMALARSGLLAGRAVAAHRNLPALQRV